MSLSKEELEKKIKEKEALAQYYEELAYSIKSGGDLIIKELNSRANDFAILIYNLASSPKDSFDYSADQIKQLKELHIRKNEVENIVAGFKPDFLLNQAQIVKKEIEQLVESGNDSAIY